MVPVELLGVRPGERVLDLCAAPGGKSTQIAAKLGGSGLLFANEIHPARAKVLSENIERLGIGNACVTNETPEHIAELFPEYFDRILVDAPCSGEGMFRKSEAACGEWSLENVALCAQRQDGILDCAARMLRPGGRLVYSTCTFAPEEDEGSVGRFLQRHGEFHIVPMASEKERLGLVGCDGISALFPFFAPGADDESYSRLLCVEGEGNLAHSREDISYAQPKGMRRLAFGLEDALRLWPQRVKGEGHFAAVLEKDGGPGEGYRGNAVNGTIKGVSVKELREFGVFCQEELRLSAGKKGCAEDMLQRVGGAVGIEGDFQYIRFGDNLYLVPARMPSLKGLKVLRPGLHLGELKKNRFEPSHALALALHPDNAAHIWKLDVCGQTIGDYLNGRTFPAEGARGWYLICVDGFGVGWGKLAGGVMKNHYPKGLRVG